MTAFLEVMSGRIFAKFDIAPKAQVRPKHFETCSMHGMGYGHGTAQIAYPGFCHIIDLRSGYFRDLPFNGQSMGKSSTSNTYQISSNRSK